MDQSPAPSKMLKLLYNSVACLMVALGLAHLFLTTLNYDALTLDAMWFAGSGLAIVFAGFLNLTLAADSGANRRGFALCLATNLVVTLLFAGALAVLPQPQVLVGALLFGFATVAVFVLDRRRTAKPPK